MYVEYGCCECEVSAGVLDSDLAVMTSVCVDEDGDVGGILYSVGASAASGFGVEYLWEYLLI